MPGTRGTPRVRGAGVQGTPGVRAPGVEQRRLFVAVWPAAKVIDSLRELQRPDRQGLRWTTPDQWHVTLSFLGVLDDEAAAGVRGALEEALEAFGARWGEGRALQARAGPESQVLGRSVLALPVSGLEGLADLVGRSCASAAAAAAAPQSGSGPGRGLSRPFRGHLTLARAKRPSALNGLPVLSLEASWDVDEVTLVRSTLHPRGARYEVEWSRRIGPSP